MRNVTCSMGVSPDGPITGPDGDVTWTAPAEELFRSAVDQVRDRRTCRSGVVLLRHRVARRH
jgi:hypothetical protein